MTIVIAAIDNSVVYIFSDTQLTHPEFKGKKPEPGFKIFFLDKNTAIAYAGSAGAIAHTRLQHIHRTWQITNNLDELAQQICDNFDSEVDFILAQCAPSPKIVKISEQRASTLTSAPAIHWIGDQDTAAFLAPKAAEGIFALSSELKNIILERKFATVGGHCVSARGNINGFKFIPSLSLHSPSFQPVDGEWTSVPFGTAATGGFGFTSVVPKLPGINGWGVFYFQGQYGEFFSTDDELTGGQILRGKANNVEEFAEAIQKELGYEVEWCGSLSG